jgi:hypothetical protein
MTVILETWEEVEEVELTKVQVVAEEVRRR